MNEHTEQQDGTLGRSIRILVFGDTADEIELYALDEARRVFGADIPLEIERSYQINPVGSHGPLIPQADGKRYSASVRVRERVS